MDRRQFNFGSASLFAGLCAATLNQAHALTLADLSNADATKGLKTALEKGALAAIGEFLGQRDENERRVTARISESDSRPAGQSDRSA